MNYGCVFHSLFVYFSNDKKWWIKICYLFKALFVYQHYVHVSFHSVSIRFVSFIVMDAIGMFPFPSFHSLSNCRTVSLSLCAISILLAKIFSQLFVYHVRPQTTTPRYGIEIKLYSYWFGTSEIEVHNDIELLHCLYFIWNSVWVVIHWICIG